MKIIQAEAVTDSLGEVGAGSRHWLWKVKFKVFLFLFLFWNGRDLKGEGQPSPSVFNLQSLVSRGHSIQEQSYSNLFSPAPRPPPKKKKLLSMADSSFFPKALWLTSAPQTSVGLNKIIASQGIEPCLQEILNTEHTSFGRRPHRKSHP